MRTSKEPDRTVYWIWNETFSYYYPLPLAGKRAFDFIRKKNQEKGGVWVLRIRDNVEKVPFQITEDELE